MAVDAPAEWAASGAMALTGPADGPPLGPPSRLVEGVARLGERIAMRTAELGQRVELDWLALLGERAALGGLSRNGRTSCGGVTRLLPTADGWVAVSLARPADIELIPAWLAGLGSNRRVSDDPWSAVTEAVADRPAADVVDGAVLLGLPAARLGERSRDGCPVIGTECSTAAPATSLRGLRVVDLTALWAGPLCTHLLALGGADVIKVESIARPDAARLGATSFFALLQAGKASVALDLDTDDGRRALFNLVGSADVVVESSRPRALEQLGIVADEILSHVGGPKVWLSITGHGRASGHRVGFGDDAAVAGGLVVGDGASPMSCADAVADPLTGMVAAAAAIDALCSSSRWLLDVAMAGVAAEYAGPTLAVDPRAVVAPPRAREAHAPTRTIGADTDAVLSIVA